MPSITVRFSKRDLDKLRHTARESGRSVSEVVRGAVLASLPRNSEDGFVGLWDGAFNRSSAEHDDC